MSDHADTLRRALCGGTTLDEAHTALDALVAENQQVKIAYALAAKDREQGWAENQRLRDALADIRNAVHDEQWSNAERLQAISDWSREALDGTPSAAQTLEDTQPHKESRSSSNAS